jgi:hypothetical protein
MGVMLTVLDVRTLENRNDLIYTLCMEGAL